MKGNSCKYINRASPLMIPAVHASSDLRNLVVSEWHDLIKFVFLYPSVCLSFIKLQHKMMDCIQTIQTWRASR